MNQVEKLDLMGVTSLAAVAAALLVAWTVTSHNLAVAQSPERSPVQAVSLNPEGSMKLTVTAERDPEGVTTPARTRTASLRPSGGPSLEVALPFVFRP
jgi:hypothetical protein